MIYRRSVRTNKWHAALVTVERNNTGSGFEYDIRINSDPLHPSASAYLTAKKARDLAAALIKAAEIVEERVMRPKRKRKVGVKP